MIYVISHDDEKFQAFQDRLGAVLTEIPDIERINITPENNTEEVPKWWMALPDRWALCCAIKTALRMALDRGEDCELYEQDAVFAEDFETRREAFLAALPEDWDMAYFGGQCLALNFYPLKEVEGNDAVLLCKNAHRNHAWVCRHSFIPRLLEWLEGERWPSRHTTDWRIGYLQMKDDVHVYIPKAGWIAGQAGGFSDLDRIERPERWWHFTPEEREAEQKLWMEFDEQKRVEAEKKRFEEWKKKQEEKAAAND